MAEKKTAQSPDAQTGTSDAEALAQQLAQLQQEREALAREREALEKQRLDVATPAPVDPERKLDETEPGGRYKVGGQWVDADGKRHKNQKDD